MGQHVWLMLATIGTELLVIVKWSQGQFPAPLPPLVRVAWSIGALLLVLYPISQVSVHVTLPLYPIAYAQRLILWSCSACSLVCPALADILCNILASQGLRLSDHSFMEFVK
jgi:hypothetical protein